MSLTHGKPITSEEVERIVSREYDARGFASLCNALAWAISGRVCNSLPSFTERVNAKDGGIDAEWTTEIPDSSGPESALLDSGLNVFQYKKRDIFAGGRNTVYSGLKSALKGALKEVHDRTGNRPKRYVCFINLDLKDNNQKDRLKAQMLDGYDFPEDVTVKIVASAELAAMLNDHPHLRSAYFATHLFATWEKAWGEHRRTKIFRPETELIGRERELESLISWVDDPDVRAISISGPPDMGKTRLALEATRHRPDDTVVAVDPHSTTVAALAALVSPQHDTVVLIEDPEPEAGEAFVRQSLACEHLKIILTVASYEWAPDPNYGHDPRVKRLALQPLEDAKTQKLLEAAKAPFSFSMASWVMSQAGGNPGVLLTAAGLAHELREGALDFIQSIGEAFERRLRRDFGEKAVTTLGLLSLLTHVGIRGSVSVELHKVIKLFGAGATLGNVLNEVERLEGAGLVQARGSYVQVRPPLLANHLAARRFRGRAKGLSEFLLALEGPARRRLLRRLAAIRTEETEALWNFLFGSTGALADLPTALRNSELLLMVAGAAPERTVSVVQSGLRELDVDGRRRIVGTPRRNLVFALEQTLFRRGTAARSLRCLALLAEAEVEEFGNSATGVFCECFYPVHPQLPLPLSDRLRVIQEMLGENASHAAKMLAIAAIGQALTQHGFVALRESTGPTPLDAPYRPTYAEATRYQIELTDHLLGAARGEDVELAEAAASKVPWALQRYIVSGNLTEGMERLESLVEVVVSGKSAVDVSRLGSSLANTVEALREKSEQPASPPAGDYKGVIARLEHLQQRLEEAPFFVRLRRWAGGWTHEGMTREDHDGQVVYRYQRELKALAVEAVGNMGLLTDEVWVWLCSQEAKRAWVFGWELGNLDEGRRLQARAEELGASQSGESVFSAYMAGRAQIEPARVARRLDQLADEGKVLGNAIVHATSALGGSPEAVSRIVNLLSARKADPEWCTRLLACGGWPEPLSSGDCLRFLKAVAGEPVEHADAVIEFLAMWTHYGKEIDDGLADLAWQCLEASSARNDMDVYHCDQLAAKLTLAAPERGFCLFEKALRRGHSSDGWFPLERHAENRFWNALLAADRNRAMDLVFSVAQEGPMQHLEITLRLAETLDQVRDGDFLVEFARRGEHEAVFVADGISSNKPGFWWIATRIAAIYPGNRTVESHLATAASGGTIHVVSGSYADFIDNCREEVLRVLSSEDTPQEARAWLERLAASFEERAKKTRTDEEDQEVDLWG